jgi:hypothetical protein
LVGILLEVVDEKTVMEEVERNNNTDEIFTEPPPADGFI